MTLKQRGYTLYGSLSFLCGAILTLSPMQASSQDDAAEVTTWNVPVVMEEATVRGKVAILENRSEDRQVLEGLRVEIWSTELEETAEPTKKSWINFRKDDGPKYIRKEKVHESSTDADGLFSLPSLEADEYFMVLGEIQFRLTVIKRDKIRAGKNDEPKILLILIPKEVVENTK